MFSQNMSFVLFFKISLEEPLDQLSLPTPPLSLTPSQLINLEESLEYFKLAWHGRVEKVRPASTRRDSRFQNMNIRHFGGSCMQTLTNNLILCMLVFFI